jgi:gliding motility-associated lipoprotein GldB
MKQSLIFILVSFILYTCKPSCKDEVDVQNININLNIIRLEDDLFKTKSPQDIQVFFRKYPLITKKYFDLDSASATDPETLNSFYNLFSNKSLYEFYQESTKRFGDVTPVITSVENMYRHLEYYYPKQPVPEAYTLMTGFNVNKPIYVDDHILVISIDYFLGKEASHRPPDYDYMRERYEKPFIPSFVAMSLSSKFNVSDLKDESMLAHMIYFGKQLYFMQKMLPCVHDSLLIMFSGSQLEDVEKNKDIIWGHFIQNQLLFETNPFLIEKYVGERPKVIEIGEKCPGRIGRWVGWQIVKKYMEEHSQFSLQDLMKEKDAQKIFKESHYKPKAN